MTTPVPGPAASVLSAILVANPDDPDSPLRCATFSQSGEPPVLPSLMNDVVTMPQDGLLDANGTWTGFLATQGLTGATAPTRWVGSTAAGAPATGTFDAGDFITSQDGNAYICTAPGSPGTWVASGGAPSGVAGGDLGSTYPNPTVVSVAHVTAGTLATTHGGTGAATAAAAAANLAVLPTAGGTMSGAIAMGSNKITGLTNGSGAQDAAAYGQTLAGGATFTTLGDTLYENATPAPARLAGNTTAQIKYLSQTGTGSVSAAPAWSVVSGTYLRAPTVVTTGTTYTTTSATFAAIASGTVNTGSFTAPASGEVVVEVDIVANASSATTYGFALAASGGVSPIVGSIVGGEAPSSTPYQPLHLCFPVTGLTGGTAYNYDIMFALVTGTLSCPALGSANTTITASNKGAPIVVAVKAV